MSLSDRISPTAMLIKCAALGFVPAILVLAVATADAAIVIGLAALAWITGGVTSMLVVWIAVWRRWVSASSFRLAIDRVLASESNESVYLAQNRAWDRIDDGAFWDPWPTDTPPPLLLVASAIATWSALVVAYCLSEVG
jgi:small-conductance mechanosensitive channel